MEDEDGPGWLVGRDHFEVALSLPMRVADIHDGLIPWLALDFCCHLGVHHGVERTLSGYSVLVSATRPLHPQS